MAVGWAWLRLDVRRRWRSLLVLTLLIAIATGTVMATVAGAERGSTAVDRLMARTLPAHVAVLPDEPGFDWEVVRSLPGVESLSTFVTGPYVVDEAPAPIRRGAGNRVRDDEQAGAYPAADTEAMRTVERPVVLDGRLADPARADEVVVTPVFADRHGLRVGDTVTLRLYEPATADAGVDTTGGDPPDGPVVESRIVGVIRSPWFHDEVGDTEGHLVPSPGLFAQYGPNLVGASGAAGNFNAMVRLRGGTAALADFTADLERVSGRSDVAVINVADDVRQAGQITGFEADALRVFALVAGIAAVVLVGQSVARYAASAVSDLQVLRAIGMTSAESGRIAATWPAIAALAGSVLGVGGAVSASRWFPIGTARLFEPDPGYDLDLPVLLAGAVGVPVVVAAGAVVAARTALRLVQSGARTRRSALATAVARLAAPVPVVTGTRFALEAGRGEQAVPTRTALAGAVAGVLGVLAAMTFAAGVDDAASNPARFGQVHQLEVPLGIDGLDFVPAQTVQSVMVADPDVAAVNDTRIAVAEGANARVPLFTLDPVGAGWEPVVTAGRIPVRPAEVALAPASAKAMGVVVGDTVPMIGTRAERQFTVTGLAFAPEGPNNDYVTGGWLTVDGFESLFAKQDSPAFKYHAALLSIRPGADREAVAARIEEAATPAIASADPGETDIPGLVDINGLLSFPTAPSKLQVVREIRTLPLFLAAFLAVLALGAVGHALATAVRRRRHEVAVLRALGMTSRQSNGVVVTQATVLALVGLAVGVPLGVALGRTVWRYVAETTPVFYVPPVAVPTMLLVVPVALLAANLLAAWPGYRAASLRISHVLRAE